MEINQIDNNQNLFFYNILKNNSGLNDKSFIQNNNTLSSNRGIHQKLQSIDSAVKAHEKTHLLVLGPYAKSGIHYDYIILSGGQKYAVGGSVGVDVKPVPGDPEATIRKARVIRSAALAPNNPSAADKRIAVEAYQMEMQAKRQLERENIEEHNYLEMTPEANKDVEKVIPGITSVPGDYEATIRKARTIRRKVFMQGKLSSQNMQILAESYQIEKQARKEIEEQKKEKNRQSGIDVYA